MGSVEGLMPTNKIYPLHPKRKELTPFIDSGSAPRCSDSSAPASRKGTGSTGWLALLHVAEHRRTLPAAVVGVLATLG